MAGRAPASNKKMRQSALNFQMSPDPSQLPPPLPPEGGPTSQKNASKRPVLAERDPNKSFTKRAKLKKSTGLDGDENIDGLDIDKEVVSGGETLLLKEKGSVVAAPSKAPSTSLQELRLVPSSLAAKTIQRLIDGYRDKSGSSYPSAISNLRGCLLAQKKPNRAENGYIQIAPISTSPRGLAGSSSKGPIAQIASRLVIIAEGSGAERKLLLSGDEMQASHLCHDPACINKNHIVVESKIDNERRKICRKKLFVCCVEREGLWEILLESVYTCPHEPACLPQYFEGRLPPKQ